MSDIADILFKFKIAQLEGKIDIYESLVKDISKLDSMEKSISDVKSKLQCVMKAWDTHLLEINHGASANHG